MDGELAFASSFLLLLKRTKNFKKNQKNYKKRVDNTRISVYNIIKDKESEKIKDENEN